MACIVEEHHDENGPLWPTSVPPYRVHVVAIGGHEGSVGTEAERLYRGLLERGLDVLLDRRKARVGVMMADADLLGAPVRAIVSSRNIRLGVLEIQYRTHADTTGVPRRIPLEGAVERMLDIVHELERPFAFVPTRAAPGGADENDG